MLNFAEEIVLLGLDDETGEFRNLPPLALEHAMAGAILMDLAVHNRIDTDLRDLTVISSEPTGDPVLDGALRQLADVGVPRPTREWLEAFGMMGPEIKKQVLARLVEKGVLRCEERRYLWVFPSRRYPSRDQSERKEIRSRLRDLLFSQDIPDQRDVVLISLLNGCRLIGEIFTDAEQEKIKSRLATIAKMDLIGQAMTRIIRDIELELAQMPTHFAI